MQTVLGRGTRKLDAVMLIVPNDGGKQGQADFLQCVHCGRYHPMGASVEAILAQKSELGFCMKCDGIHCGESCQECVPIEKQIERIERGLIIPGV